MLTLLWHDLLSVPVNSEANRKINVQILDRHFGEYVENSHTYKHSIMDMSYLNYWAILVSALATFLIGGLWYSPALFSKPWMRENGFTEESLKGRNMAKIFGLAFMLALISAFNLAMFLGPQADLAFGAGAGFAAGFGWVATFLGTYYLFEGKSLTLFLINAGYGIVSLTVQGIILGAWR